MRFGISAFPVLAAALAFGSCGARAPAEPSGEVEGSIWASARAEWETAARECTARGDHLGASRYLEAALVAGGDEARLLPLLAAAQIRAGRLRAARESVARLEAVAPDRPGLSDLVALLDAFIDPPPRSVADRAQGGPR